MPGIQIGFLIFTVLGPALLWILSRHLDSPRFAKWICWLLALALLTAKISTVIAVWRESKLTADYALPMHLCDWALVTTIVALVLRRQLCFELAYFWGIAGTAQALITPALDSPDFWRIFAFFTVHSVIPAGVLWLMFDFKIRPQRGAWLRVALWSQVYLVVTLLVNSATGGNYGFLAGRPAVRSMLDFFSDTRWLYILQIDLTALLFFLLLDVPWQIARWRSSRTRGGIADASVKA